jgi:hypothetical protein
VTNGTIMPAPVTAKAKAVVNLPIGVSVMIQGDGSQKNDLLVSSALV